LTHTPPSLADFAALAAIYKTTTFLDARIHPDFIQLPYPILYGAAKFALWSLYTFWAGLVGTGIWVLAHECGHQAFSESKLVNNTVGWILHSAYVPSTNMVSPLRLH
jgi:omega-6 fatty acid desaturase (delta-12 desaturase)